MLRSAANGVLAVIFVLAVSLPLGANLSGGDGFDPDAENREPARFPALDGTWASLADVPRGLGRWFDDHFGFRADLVRLNAEIQFFCLETSPSPSVLLGKDGWLFYAEDGAMEDYANAPALSAEEVANWRVSVVRARDWLRGRGVAYVFTVPPDKHVIYPEQMPRSVRRIGSTSRMDQVFGALAGAGVAVDLRPELFEAKTRERIYHRTDTHWNERGAFVAYRMIVDAVRRQVPAVPPAWQRSDFEEVSRDEEGRDLAGMMGLKPVLREEVLALEPRRPRLARVVEPAGAAPDDEEGRLVTEIPGSTLPRAVIFRDSFVSPLAPFLSEHFSRAVYLWQNDFDADVVVKEHPDVVIQEIVGRHLYAFTPSPELVPSP
jgi:alginate O-acetyltransferase complex protein AlgJ